MYVCMCIYMYVQLKSEVYIHLSQIHLNSVSQFLTFNSKFPVLGQLGSPLYFKNVKSQNNSRENDLFPLLFILSHSQWVRRIHTLNQYLVVFVFKLFNLGQTFCVAFHKLPTISWVNFVPFLLTELVYLSQVCRPPCWDRVGGSSVWARY